MHTNLSSLASIFVSLKFPDLDEYFLLFQKKKSFGQIGFLQRFSLYICYPFSFIPPPNVSHANLHWAHLFFKLLLPKYSPSHYAYCVKIRKLHLDGLTILIEAPKYALSYYWTILHTKRPDFNVYSPTGKKLFFKFKTLVMSDLIVATLPIRLTYVKQKIISKRKLDII